MLFFLDRNNFFPNVRHIGYASFLKNWIHFTRTTDEYILYLVIEGELFLEEEGKHYHLVEGDIFLLEPNKRHKGYQLSTCKYYYFHFNKSTEFQVYNESEQFIDELIQIRKRSMASDPFLPSETPLETEIIIPKHFTIKNKPLLITISSIAYSAIEDYYQKYENYKLLVSANMLQILILASREYITTLFNKANLLDGSSKVMFSINKLIQFINQNYQDKLNTELIEKYMGLNYDYLNELMKKHYKTTIGKYIQSVRINSAKMLIRETDLKFSEIAYLVGINDPYYFSKLFKNLMGLTPTQYANLVKTGKEIEEDSLESDV
jgi:YesN/AraC family two-component response regulator